MKKLMRNKKKVDHVRWAGVAAGVIVLCLLALVAWWLIRTKTSSSVRKKSLEKLSIMADRMEELSEAMKKRNTPLKAPTLPKSAVPPAALQKPAPADSEIKPSADSPPPPQSDLSHQDQEELRNFFKKLEKE